MDAAMYYVQLEYFTEDRKTTQGTDNICTVGENTIHTQVQHPGADT